MMTSEALETIGTVAVALPPVHSSMRCEDVDLRFQSDPDLAALAVVQDARPVGLINRYDLITQLSRDYGRALYAKKPVSALMDRAPLIVDASISVDRLESLIADEHQSALLRGFIVTRNSRYYGVGTALSLLQLGMARSERRNRALDRARQQAEEASLSKTRFLANMSHELRTPLNAIIGFAEVIQKQLLGPMGNARYAEYVDDILSSGQHLLSLINNILDMSKIESGSWRIQPEMTDPVEIMEASLRTFRERAEGRGVFMTMTVDARLFEGFVDRQALRQILLNLISNAVKFTPAGGRIEVGAAPLQDGAFGIWVTDTGIGIAPEHIPVVLAPFGQVENDLTRQYEGTGLGLPLVKSLVEMHGGRFAIQSTPGEGTTIRAEFPPPPILGAMGLAALAEATSPAAASD
ncbi:HAMP domain-containing histidine kinase [Ferrovibrio terrae]|uniref:histidine kinase n=1 Tax=Ferrovibrio terrae TaxID=2594003 RepID=A0A516H207_9PROT|nr:HAMP domain-containing sensor histidine kinase [Ferrovibrio terrae]QDO97807.1 HAMP domain-containing histidine kinase [Ferrovibrio terrae]